MAKVQHPYGYGLPVRFENIPDDLKPGKWCVWKAIPKANNKYDKIPFNADGVLKTSQPKHWLTYDQAKALYEQGGYNGVGRLWQKDGFTGVDLDRTGEAPQDIKDIGETYAEKSPSGTGLRVIYQTDTIPDHDMTTPFEVYSGNSARFLTIWGIRKRKALVHPWGAP